MWCVSGNWTVSRKKLVPKSRQLPVNDQTQESVPFLENYQIWESDEFPENEFERNWLVESDKLPESRHILESGQILERVQFTQSHQFVERCKFPESDLFPERNYFPESDTFADLRFASGWSKSSFLPPHAHFWVKRFIYTLLRHIAATKRKI